MSEKWLAENYNTADHKLFEVSHIDCPSGTLAAQTPLARIGKPAVPFELKDGTGNMVRLEDYAGGWLLLVFHRHLG